MAEGSTERVDTSLGQGMVSATDHCQPDSIVSAVLQLIKGGCALAQEHVQSSIVV